MNFIKQKGFHLLIIFTSSEGSRITGNSTNVRWGFKEKWNGQQLSCTLWLQALNSHEIESDAATKSQQWLPNAIWLVDPRVCVCVCVCVCVSSLFVCKVFYSDSQGNRSDKFSHKQTPRCSSITLCASRIDFLLKTTVKWTVFPLLQMRELEREEPTHSWL